MTFKHLLAGLSFFLISGSFAKSENDINTEQLQKILADKPNTLLIDVRTQTEIPFMGGSIDAANEVNIPRGWLEFRIEDQAKGLDTPIIVYCGTNVRSPPAAKTLKEMGYTNVLNYADGFQEWKKQALPIRSPDKAPNSILYSKPEKILEHVWSAIGATAPPTYANSGHNNNLSFIITDEGVVVVNAGDNYLIARALHDEIKTITDKPVKYVVLENGQGHAILGTSYWQEQGATVIAHADAAAQIEQYGESILGRMQSRTKDKSLGTKLAKPDKTFDGEKHVIKLGGKTIELLNLGPAHSPGDIMVWLPEDKLIITGDMAFHQRMLPVFEHTNTDGWINTWDRLLALKPEYVIPGHGAPTNTDEVTKYTKDYLVYMRGEIEKVLDDGGDLNEAYKIDQSAYAHLHTFKELNLRNAARIFREMEFE
ncbi:MAG: SoxH protein, homolog [uncultured Thiotrichaceae bacterium]|uniref:SoxH protein, homolog n=1 Tax=uncultured Thiotrichaceae bacterium TaxID=298394 RepID=A0A6S6U5P3_9GAMM|nr:MAG: SoxH protein, homolog [uncultured Thiotrichaceae bacterium]